MLTLDRELVLIRCDTRVLHKQGTAIHSTAVQVSKPIKTKGGMRSYHGGNPGCKGC